MKSVLKKTVDLCLLLIILASCSGRGAHKFEGEWVPEKDKFGGVSITKEGVIVIKEENGSYYFIGRNDKGDENQLATLRYDRDKDVLTYNEGGQNFEISYDKETKRLRLRIDNHKDVFELKRK